MDFLEYTLGSYRERIAQLESLIDDPFSDTGLAGLCREASAMKKFLLDIRAEGYEYTYARFNEELDTVARLDRILAAGFARMDECRGENAFMLCEAEPLVVMDSSLPYRTVELHTYLAELAAVSSADIDMDLVNSVPGWVERTEVILGAVRDYVRWIAASAPSPRCICLLRDTLLVHFGLQQCGLHSVPLMLGRAFLRQYDDSYFDDPVMDVLYTVLHHDADIPGSVAERYRSRYRAIADERRAAMDGRIRQLLDRALDGGGYTAIETGLQGTMPLLLHAVDDRVDGFLMYTTVPWLVPHYRDCIYTDNYHHLRDLETIVTHDALFQFDEERDGIVFIREYDNPLIRALAYYEIVRFRELLNPAGCRAGDDTLRYTD